MERWIKYKNNIVNLGNIKTLRVHKADEDMLQWHKEVGASKTKKWILSADHDGLGAFESKDDAMNAAEDIVNGKYDMSS